MWLYFFAKLCPGGGWSDRGECAAVVLACGVQATTMVEGGQTGAVLQEAGVCGAE